MADLSGAVCRTSTRSGNGGATCVEVARNVPGVVGVRDSKNSGGPELAFGPAGWSAFMTGVKAGSFDLS